MQEFQEKGISFYCLCSNLSFNEILEKQKICQLPFKELLEQHTRCSKGCGSCVDKLQIYLQSSGFFVV